MNTPAPPTPSRDDRLDGADREPAERPRHPYEDGFGSEDGQAMLFAVITFFFVFVTIFSVFRAGQISHFRLQMQNAADMAAYSGANVQANSVSMTAFVNRGQAFIFYNLMRYSVDCSVFALMAEYKDHKGFFLSFLANGYFGHRTAPDDYIDTASVGHLANSNVKQLYSDAKSNWDDDVPDGVDWVRDLYEINRSMADATPILVRREVFTTATENGASRVCMFPDTRRSFQSPESTSQIMNFNPHHTSQAYMEHEEDLNRWAYKIAVDDYWPEDNKFVHPIVMNEKIPEWYDAIRAKPKKDEDYFQIRECWNERDLDHDQGHIGTAWPWQMDPPGHFHHWHAHFKQVGSVPVLVAVHKNGHNNDNHVSSWDYYVPVIPMPFPIDGYQHHAVLDCPTCFRFNFLKWDADGDLSTDIYLDLTDTSVGKYKAVPIDDKWPHKDPGKYAPPLVLAPGMFKYGVNVGAWRDKAAKNSAFVDEADWGYFTVASAKIGPLVNGRVVVYRQDTRQTGNKLKDFDAWIESTDNLYYIDWGAKLVPVRDAMYDQSTGFLFRGLVGGIWMQSWDDIQGDTAVNNRLRNMILRGRAGAGRGSGFGTITNRGTFNWYDDPALSEAVRH